MGSSAWIHDPTVSSSPSPNHRAKSHPTRLLMLQTYVTSTVTSDFLSSTLRQEEDKQGTRLRIPIQNGNYCIIIFATLLVM